MSDGKGPGGNGRNNAAFPPGLRQAITEAVKGAVREAINDLIKTDAIGTVQMRAAFENCSKKLEHATHKIKELETAVNLYQEIAETRGKRTEQIMHDMDRLKADVALMLSVIQNRDEESA